MKKANNSVHSRLNGFPSLTKLLGAFSLSPRRLFEVTLLLFCLFASGLLVGFIQTRKILDTGADAFPLSRGRMLKDIGVLVGRFTDGKLEGAKKSDIAITFEDFSVDDENEVFAIKSGLLSGFPNGKFHPDYSVTRGEVFSLAADLLKICNPDKFLASPGKELSDLHPGHSWIDEKLSLLMKIKGISKIIGSSPALEKMISYNEWKEITDCLKNYIKENVSSKKNGEENTYKSLTELRSRLANADISKEKTEPSSELKVSSKNSSNQTDSQQSSNQQVESQQSPNPKATFEANSGNGTQASCSTSIESFPRIPLEDNSLDTKIARTFESEPYNPVTEIKEKPTVEASDSRISFPDSFENDSVTIFDDNTAKDKKSITVTGKMIDNINGKPLKNGSMIVESNMVQADEDGNFTFSGHANQLVDITAYCEGYQPLNMKHKIGFRRGPLFIGLKKAFSQVEGFVNDLISGNPVEGAKIQVAKRFGITDKNGYYKISGISPTWNQLSVSAQGYMQSMEVLFIGQNGTKRDLKLRALESESSKSMSQNMSQNISPNPSSNPSQNLNQNISQNIRNTEEEEMLTESPASHEVGTFPVIPNKRNFVYHAK
ncbi:MAG: carboxypeptidase regulatory-like domain-containing protein [Candidatus Riflebacteria bacterium]|nr:carboxypeptidase regulatory-like domain-containing protein [Candidatus Riflebacteria bacterium]